MIRNYNIGEIYYEEFNFLYQDNPYEYPYECVGINDNGEPVFESRYEEPHKEEGLKFAETLMTKEETESFWDQEKIRVKEVLKDQNGIIEFMVDKIEELVRSDQYGYSFSTLERETFKKRLKDVFGKEVNI